ncbi:golgin subfamily A member 1 [Copidosoma floridanum]|uniref:golgin subfamily A member 1 n=1 Tax=Copidosoma floridanum TaxID=29053 RepID=UPI0006C989FC|nr:golgin subfamily A member 1 [Copidosoma floridanum]
MFATLKNKIKEEIGSDVSAVIRNAGSVRGLNRHLSQAGSGSSISSSQISLDETIREENNVSPSLSYRLKRENSFELKLEDGTPLSAKAIKRLESREDEWRKRLQKKETEFLKKMEKKEEEHRVKMLETEKEWKKIIDMHEKEKAKLVEDRQKAESAKAALEVALNNAEEYKKKLCSFQEDVEQMEGLQHQELAKIKHLLLSKEHEVEDKSQLLKTALTEIDNLKMELSRLRRYEDELNNVQDEMESLRHSTQREKARLSSQLAQTEEEVRHLKDKLFLLEQRVSLESGNSEITVDDRIADLMRERALLERKLEEAHLHLSDIKTSWSAKISSLETQVGRLSRQAGEEGLERRRVEQEKQTLSQRIKDLETEIEVTSVVMATKDAKLLRMTEDIDEMASELKELRANVDDEVDEYKRQIEQRTREADEQKALLEEAKSDLASKEVQLAEMKSVYEEETSKILTLQSEVDRLKAELESEKAIKINMDLSLEKEKTEKDSALLRTAKISQEIQIAKQETKTQELENAELQNQLDNLADTLKNKTKDLADITKKLDEALLRINDFEKAKLDHEKMEGNEKTLKMSLLDLEEQLNEKNKTIKVLQQRLADMKKTLHRELRVPSSSLDSDLEPAASAAILNPSSSKTVTAKQNNSREDDINFVYLKHVLIKFLTSREYEALHLTRAVATLLHFSPEEEKLLQETLEWKMSWFGTRPNLGMGQTAKAIPPS